MKVVCNQRLTELVHKSLKQGISLHQLENLLDWRENVQPSRVAVMGKPVQSQPTNVPQPAAQ